MNTLAQDKRNGVLIDSQLPSNIVSVLQEAKKVEGVQKQLDIVEIKQKFA